MRKNNVVALRGILFTLIILLTVSLMAGSCSHRKEGALYGSSDIEQLYANGIKLMQMKRFDMAEELFREITVSYPLDPLASESQLKLADLYYMRGDEDKADYDQAASFYTMYVSFHPASDKAPYALFQKGMSYFKQMLSVSRDQTSTRKALFAFDDLLMAYPESAYARRAREMSGFCKERLALREFNIGKFYYKKKNYKGALLRFKGLLEDYPISTHIDDSLYYIGESYFRLGEFDLADEAFDLLINDFPESPHRAAAASRLSDG